MKILQPLAHLQRHGRVGGVVQNRLVIFINKHHGTLADLFMRQTDEFAQLTTQTLMGTSHAQALLVITEDF